MSQLELTFPEPRARSTDPQTSKDAAKKIKSGSKRHRILSAMALMTGELCREHTTKEIAKFLGWHRDSVSPHMKPLAELGYVGKSGFSRYDPVTKTHSETWALTLKYYRSGEKISYTKPDCCPTCRRPL